MHKIFGIKENINYTDRIGAYLLPIKDGKIAVIKTPKGYFFIGGGKDGTETDEDCIKRECLEEIGYKVNIKEKICSAEAYIIHSEIGGFHPIQTYYLGELGEKITEPIESDHKLRWIKIEQLKGKMFAEMQNWALEQIKEEQQ